MAEGACKRVLVVEDTPPVRDALLTLLRSAGFEADGAADGQEGLERLRAGPRYDLILLDLMMPGLDGLEFLRQRRLEPAARGIPAIVLTVAEAGHEEEARSLGAAEFLTKPIEAYALVDTLRRYC